jgi:hypothetical protein
MLNAIVVSIRFILLILGGQKQVALENAALRQQLAVFKRNRVASPPNSEKLLRLLPSVEDASVVG